MDKEDIKQDKKLIKKAFGMHDKQEHPGKHTDLSKLKKGGKTMKKVDSEKNPGLAKLPTEVRNKMGYMKKGGMPKMAKGGVTGMQMRAMGRNLARAMNQKHTSRGG